MLPIAEKFLDRGISYIQGVHLLVDTQITGTGLNTEKRTFLHNDVDAIQQLYRDKILSIETFDEGLLALDLLLKDLIEFIVADLDIEKPQAFQTLCQAEQLAVWKRGRKPLITELHVREHLIQQREEPVCQLSHDQQNEYLRFQQDDFPEWSKIFPEWQKIYFKNLVKNATKDNLNSLVLSIPSSLRTLPGLADYALHQIKIFNETNEVLVESQRFCSTLPSPIQISDTNERQRLTKQNLAQLIENHLHNVSDVILKKWSPVIEPGQILSIPVLVQTLLSPIWVDRVLGGLYPEHNESRFLADKESSLERLQDKLASFRGVIEIRHGKTLYRINPVLVSTNYPINFLRQETLLIQSHTTSNSQNGVILLQCLSHFIRDFVLSKFDKISHPEQNYYLKLLKALMTQTLAPLIEENSLFFTISPALPLFRRKLKNFTAQMNQYLHALTPGALAEENPDRAHYLSQALTPSQLHDLQLLLNAVRDYIVLYNTPRQWIHHKEMFLSSLEEIITERIGGISHSSSLNNSNRKSMQIIHTDSMLIYFGLYRTLPRYNDDPANRRRFVEIYVDLFFSEHHQRRIGQNAPGAEGIQHLIVLPLSPGMYMIPKDIVQEMMRRNKQAIKMNAKFAKLNHPANPEELTTMIGRMMKTWISTLQQVFSF